MFIENFRISGLAMLQIFIMGAIGFTLVKRGIFSEEGLSALSRLLIIVIFPALIFSQITQNFSFNTYALWWIFPLISLLITFLGFLLGAALLLFLKNSKHKLQFLSLISFQNSGYLPLAIAGGMFIGAKLAEMFIYIFMLLLGFDLVFWSFGIYLLTYKEKMKFRLSSIFSPPVIANLCSLLFVILGLKNFMPQAVLKPISMIGSCTLPLAMFVVGGNLAAIHLGRIEKKAVSLIVLGKLFILPAIGLFLVLFFKLPQLIGLLVVMQLSMPSAVSLSVIIRSHWPEGRGLPSDKQTHKQEDALISQGIFFTHLISIITIPLFLSIYLYFNMVK